MRKLIKILAEGILGFLALAAGIMLAAGLFGIRLYGILSGSMEPVIHTGSVVFVNTNTPYEEIEEGDVIMFTAGSAADGAAVRVCHRVAAVTEEGLETKGDANDARDASIVTKESFGGTVLFAIPFLWYVRTFFMGSIFGKSLLAGAAGLLFLAISGSETT